MVNRQKASVLYYSIAEGHLHVWLILPVKGIVKFHQARIEDDEGDNMLEQRIESMHESLGVSCASISADTDDPERPFSMQLDALGDKLNGEGDRSGFLRMVNRSSRLNASSYSLSSLFSVGSLGAASSLSAAAAASRHGSSRSRRSNRSHWAGPSSARALYQMLVAPMEDDLPEGYPCELMLVLEGDLYLVPFAMLKAPDWTECLCEKYSLIVAPSLSSTRVAKAKPSQSATPLSTSLVVGNPRLPSTVSEEWGWVDIPQSAQEANTVAEILQVSAVTGEEATKTHIMRQMEQAEIIHLSCHVSFKLSAVVLSPGNTDVLNPAKAAARRYSINSDTIQEEDDLKSEVASTIDMPALSEFLLTAADILNLRLSAKMVVVSSCYSRDEQGQVTSEGLVSLTRALLAAGAHCVVASLWPVPATAVKVVMKTLYSSLLQGARASRALADAMTTAQNTKQLQHPANWAGFVVVGADVRLSNKVALMGQALRDMISTPEMCKEALRVTLHLVSLSNLSVYTRLLTLEITKIIH
jgi:CHAT domain-containing protein